MSSLVTPAPALRNVLIVDDHEGSRSALGRLLRLSGYHVCQATTVQEALASAAREPCDLLISDIGLPDGSGVELMRELSDRARRDGRALCGIAVSGFTDGDNIHACAQAGFREFLPKPVSYEKVLAAIERMSKASHPSP
jgi:DNA-binding NtrC family response regulator